MKNDCEGDKRDPTVIIIEVDKVCHVQEKTQNNLTSTLSVSMRSFALSVASPKATRP